MVDLRLSSSGNLKNLAPNLVRADFGTNATGPQVPARRQLAGRTRPENCPATGRTGHGARDAGNQFRRRVGAAAARLLRLQMSIPIPPKVGVLPGVLASCGENCTKTVSFYYVFSRHENHVP